MSYARPTMSSFGKENTTPLTTTTTRRGSGGTTTYPLGETRRNKWPNNTTVHTSSSTTSKVLDASVVHINAAYQSSTKSGRPVSGSSGCWKGATTSSSHHHHHAPPSRSPDPAPTPYRIERSHSHTTRPHPSLLKTTDSVSISMGRQYDDGYDGGNEVMNTSTLQRQQQHHQQTQHYPTRGTCTAVNNNIHAEEDDDHKDGERTTPTRLNLMLAHANTTPTAGRGLRGGGGVWGRVCEDNRPTQTPATITANSLDSILAVDDDDEGPKGGAITRSGGINRSTSFHLPSVPSVPSSMAPSHSASRVSEVTDRAASMQPKVVTPTPAISATTTTTTTTHHKHPANTLRDYSTTAPSSKGSARRLSATTAAPTVSSSTTRTSRTLSSTPSTVMSPVRATRPTVQHTRNNDASGDAHTHPKTSERLAVNQHHDPSHAIVKETPTVTIKDTPPPHHQPMEELYLICPICGEGGGGTNNTNNRRGAPSIVAPRIKEGCLPDVGEQTMLIGMDMAKEAVSELVQHTSECLAQRCLGEKHFSRSLSIPPAQRIPHTGSAAYKLLLHDPLHLQDYYHPNVHGDDGKHTHNGQGDDGCLYYTPAAGSCWWSVGSGDGRGGTKMADVHVQVRRLHNELSRLASSVSCSPLHGEDGDGLSSQLDTGMSEFECQLTARLDSLRSRRVGASAPFPTSSSSSSSHIHPPYTLPSPPPQHQSSQLSIESIRDYNTVAYGNIYPTLGVQCCGGSGEEAVRGGSASTATHHHTVPWGTTLHTSSSSAFATHALLCWVITLDVVVLHHPHQGGGSTSPMLMRVAAPLSDVHTWSVHQAATRRISRFALLLGNDPSAATTTVAPKAKPLPVEDLTLQHLIDFVAWAVVQKPTQQRLYQKEEDGVTSTTKKQQHTTLEEHPTAAHSQLLAAVLSTTDSLHIVPGRFRHMDDDSPPASWSSALPMDTTDDDRLSTLPLPLKSTRIVDAGCTSYMVVV